MSKGPVRKPGNASQNSPKKKATKPSTAKPMPPIEAVAEKDTVASVASEKATVKPVTKLPTPKKPSPPTKKPQAKSGTATKLPTKAAPKAASKTVPKPTAPHKKPAATPEESPKEIADTLTPGKNQVATTTMSQSAASKDAVKTAAATATLEKEPTAIKTPPAATEKKAPVKPPKAQKAPTKKTIHITAKQQKKPSTITVASIEQTASEAPPVPLNKAVCKDKRKGIKIAIIAASSVVAALLVFVAIFTAITLSSDVIYDGIYINGVAFGGMTREEAQETFDASHISDWALDDNEQRITNVSVNIDDVTLTITTDDIDLRHLTDDAVERAFNYGREGNVFTRMRTIVRLRNNPIEINSAAELNLDIERITEIVDDFIEPRAVELQHDSVEINNESIYIWRGADGVEFDNQAIADSFVEAFLSIVTGTVPEPVSFAAAVTERQTISLDEIAEEVYIPMRNAASQANGQDITEEQSGLRLDIDKANELLETISDNPVVVPLTVVKPTLTAAALRTQQQTGFFNDVLADIHTDILDFSAGRQTNVRLSSQLINGMILNPGDVFSFNRRVGQRTAARGFQSGIGFIAGRTEQMLGGGICQVSSTLYMAALRGNMEIVERHQHGFRVAYSPLSQDAAIFWGSLDFRFRNTSPYPIRLVVEHPNSNRVRVRIMGTRTNNYTVSIVSTQLGSTPIQTVHVHNPALGAGNQRVTDGGSTGFTSEAHRRIYRDGVLVRTEFLGRDVYRMRPRTIEVGSADMVPNHQAAPPPADPPAPPPPSPTPPPTDPPAPPPPPPSPAPPPPSPPPPSPDPIPPDDGYGG